MEVTALQESFDRVRAVIPLPASRINSRPRESNVMSRGVERFTEMISHSNPAIAAGEVFACIEDGHDDCAYTVLRRRASSKRNILKETLAAMSRRWHR